MKKFRRENIKKYRNNQHQAKVIQSQSPPHKKLLKKIENNFKEGENRRENSLQDTYLLPEQKQEAQDFRVEIEKRYEKSISNKNYLFPLKKHSNDSESDTEHSLESLRHVTVYDLASQNQNKKYMAKDIFRSDGLKDDLQNYYSKQSQYTTDNPADYDIDDESDPETPIELRIRDKTSSTYRKLIQLLEKNPMFSHNSTNNTRTKLLNNPQEWSDGNDKTDRSGLSASTTKRNCMSQGYTKQSLLANFTTQVSTADTQKGNFKDEGLSDIECQNERGLNKSSEKRKRKVKKVQSEEKVNTRLETCSSVGKSPIIKRAKETCIPPEKLSQEGLKRQIYNQSKNLNKSITPHQYSTEAINIKEIFSREGPFKTYNDDARPKSSSGANRNSQPHRKNPLEALYQRVQNEVNSKSRLSNHTTGAHHVSGRSHNSKITIKDTNRSHSALSRSTTPLKRDKTPKDLAKYSAFTNFYSVNQGSADRTSTTNFSCAQTTIAKENSAKILRVKTPPVKKMADKIFYTSYDFTQPQALKRPAFKLDLSKRNQGQSREALSSSRYRTKTPEKSHTESSQTIFMRTSYDLRHTQNAIPGPCTQKKLTKPDEMGAGVHKNNSLTHTSQSAKRGSNK